MMNMNDVPLGVRVANWGPEEVARYANEMAVMCSRSKDVGSVVDSEFNITPHGDTEEAMYLRGSDPAFWRRQATKVLRIKQEARQLKLKAVGRFSGSQYSSDEAMGWKSYKDAAYLNYINTAVMYNRSTNKSTPMVDIVGSEAARLAEYYTFIKGVEELSAGLNWAMLTITLPGEYHANPANKATHQWNEVTPDQSHKEIAEGWKRVRANLAHFGIRLSGVRTAEPMADGTPHWHCAFFYKNEDQLDKISQAVLRSFPAGLRIRHSRVEGGRLKFNIKQYDSLDSYRLGDYHENANKGAQCQLDLGAAASLGDEDSSPVAAFSTYILKYVAKNLEVSSSTSGKWEEDDTSIAESGPADRVVSFRKTFGIRAINFYGLPVGARSGWAALRRVPLEGEELAKIPSNVLKLAEICQQAKGAGIGEYLRKLGGLHADPLQAEFRVKVLNSSGLNSYGEAVKRPVGVTVQCLSSGEIQEYVIQKGVKEVINELAAEAIREAIEAGSCSHTQQWGPNFDDLVQIRTTVSMDNNQIQAIKSDPNQSHYIAAGAGSGKTRVIVQRILHLIDKGVDPASIAVTTFTREAADSLQDRLIVEASKVSEELQADMFNSDSNTLKSKAEEVQVGTMHALASKWLGFDFKGSYDELIGFSTIRGVKDKHLLVDESQDLTAAQWEWIDSHSKTLFSVGDFRQAIYGWRGASSHVFLDRFESSESSRILDVNYRSSSAIVALSNVLSNTSEEFKAKALRVGGSVTWDIALSEEEELEKMAAWLTSVEAGSVVVLVRSNGELAYVKSRLTLLGLGHIDVLTIHAAKGLEWDNVGLYCGQRKVSELAEDAREVMYVACTRSIEALHVTSTGSLPKILGEALELSSLIADCELYGDPDDI